mmetsp:Transcript_29906/g.68994  ORF Transcript_29906/g.68994 Transcript_29906/m.68994 type:complete len:125 (+) Transcript_29906:260-634(+)
MCAYVTKVGKTAWAVPSPQSLFPLVVVAPLLFFGKFLITTVEERLSKSTCQMTTKPSFTIIFVRFMYGTILVVMGFSQNVVVLLVRAATEMVGTRNTAPPNCVLRQYFLEAVSRQIEPTIIQSR